MNEIIAMGLISIGLLFFVSGSIGLIRLPDLFSRLHALAKADNVGLAFIMLGVASIETGPANLFKLILIWFLVLASSAVSAHLISRHAIRRGK